MILIKIRHYYDSGVGNTIGEVWCEVNKDDDWSKAQCHKYVADQDNDAYVLDHNEYSRPTYYMIENALPDWTDDSWYDYDQCESKDKDGAACDSGCDVCPYIQSCYKLQRKQQVAWISANGVLL